MNKYFSLLEIMINDNYWIYFCVCSWILTIYFKFPFVHNHQNIFHQAHTAHLKFKRKRDKTFKRCNVVHFLFTSSYHSFFSRFQPLIQLYFLRLLIYFPTSGSDPRKKNKIPVEWQIPATDPEIDFTVVQWETIRGRSSYIKSLERANRIGVQHQTLISSTTSDSVATRASIKGQPDRVIERPFTLPSPPCVDVEISDNTH